MVQARNQNIGLPVGIFGSFRKVVTTAGTRVCLVASSTPCEWATVTAETDNTGTITVGDVTVVDTVLTRVGKNLTPGVPYTLLVKNLNQVYIDSSVNGDGVTVIYGG